MSILKLSITGRVGKDPETREVGNSKVTKFTVAHSEKYKKNGETVENTTWVTVEGWDKTGEVLAQYVKKGDQIYIEGTPKAEAWTDKDGAAKGGLVVRVREFTFLGGSRTQETEAIPKAEVGNSISNGGDDAFPAKNGDIIEYLDSLPHWSDDYGIVHYCYRGGKKHYRIGYGDWVLYTGRIPKAIVEPSPWQLDPAKSGNAQSSYYQPRRLAVKVESY